MEKGVLVLDRPEDSEIEDKMERHRLTINGMAEAIGMIAVNSANPEDQQSHHEKKKDRQLEELLLSGDISDLEKYLEELTEKIEAGQSLIQAYKNGERDFDSAHHVHLLEVTGWTKQDILSGNAEDLLQDLNTEFKFRSEQLQYLKSVHSSEHDPQQKSGTDPVMDTSIQTGFNLTDEFKQAGGQDEPTVNEPSVNIPPPGMTVGF